MYCTVCQEPVSTRVVRSFRESCVKWIANDHVFTQDNLVEWGVVGSQKMASRLLEKMEFEGCVQQVGRITATRRGQPRKVYGNHRVFFEREERLADQVRLADMFSPYINGIWKRVPGREIFRGGALNFVANESTVGLIWVREDIRNLVEAIYYIRKFCAGLKEKGYCHVQLVVFDHWTDMSQLFLEHTIDNMPDTFIGTFDNDVFYGYERKAVRLSRLLGKPSQTLKKCAIGIGEQYCNQCVGMINDGFCVGCGKKFSDFNHFLECDLSRIERPLQTVK